MGKLDPMIQKAYLAEVQACAMSMQRLVSAKRLENYTLNFDQHNFDWVVLTIIWRKDVGAKMDIERTKGAGPAEFGRSLATLSKDLIGELSRRVGVDILKGVKE